MDDIVTSLLADTGARAVWLLGGTTTVGNEPRNELLANAVSDPTLEAPARLYVEGETYLDLGEWQLFALPIGDATLVVRFDHRSSLGLIRLRVRHATAAIESALANRRD